MAVMDFEELGDLDGVPVRVPTDEGYRTCSVCGRDCEPNPLAEDGLGVRVAFVCPHHGAQSIVDPFADSR